MALEHRHWADQLYLSLQKAELSYGVPVVPWDASTVTLLTDIASEAVHELYDDDVVGMDLVRLGHTVSQDQVLVRQSVRIPFAMPYVTPHVLAGLVGLALGRVTTQQQPLLTSFEHTITLADPTDVPSITAQIGHLQNRYWTYPGIKADGFTLALNGPYISLAVPLVGSGLRTDTTDMVHFETPSVTVGTPPEYHIVLDELGSTWYLSIDTFGRILSDTTAPAGTGLVVGTGITLRAANGFRYRIGVGTNGGILSEPGGLEPVHFVETAALRDPAARTWYLWIEADGVLSINTTPPPALPQVLPERWLQTRDSQIFLQDVTSQPLILTPETDPFVGRQESTHLGSGAVTLSSRVVNLAVTHVNGLSTAEAYRLDTAAVRGECFAPHPHCTVTLALQVDTAREAEELAAYFAQQRCALEWQTTTATQTDPVVIQLVTEGTPPEYHILTDSAAGVWYLSITTQGEPLLSPTPPEGTGLDVGTGLVLLALDGYAYGIGGNPQQEVITTRGTYYGTAPHVVEICALRDSAGDTWYLWTSEFGAVTVSRQPRPIVPWHVGFTLVIPRLQWAAFRRLEQAQCDILECTGTVLDDGRNPPLLLRVYNAQPAYLQ